MVYRIIEMTSRGVPVSLFFTVSFQQLVSARLQHYILPKQNTTNSVPIVGFVLVCRLLFHPTIGRSYDLLKRSSL